MQLRNEIEIAAPAARVWALTLAIEGWPAVTPTVTSVERLDSGPLRVGSQARLKQPGQGPAVWTVTVLEPEHSFAWSTRVLGLTMTGRHEIVPTAAGCRNVLTLDIDGFGATLFGWLLGGQMAKAIATENAGFKRVAEAG